MGVRCESHRGYFVVEKLVSYVFVKKLSGILKLFIIKKFRTKCFKDNNKFIGLKNKRQKNYLIIILIKRLHSRKASLLIHLLRT